MEEEGRYEGSSLGRNHGPDLHQHCLCSPVLFFPTGTRLVSLGPFEFIRALLSSSSPRQQLICICLMQCCSFAWYVLM